MSAPPPLPFVWQGDGFTPASPYWQRQADRHYVIGETYTLERREQRSPETHAHFFACLADAHANLPEDAAERLPTPEHLRKFALIKCGFRDQRSIACASKAEALRLAAFVKPMDDFALVVAQEAVVTVYTAKSQSMRAMGKAEFQRSKQAVLDYVAGLIGTTADALGKNASQAA